MVLSSILILLGVMYKKMTQMTVQMMPMPVAEAQPESEEELNRLNELIAEYIQQRNTDKAKETEAKMQKAANDELKALKIEPKQRMVAVAAASGGNTSAPEAPKAPVRRVVKKTRHAAGKSAVSRKPSKKLKKPQMAKPTAHSTLLPPEKSFFFRHPETGEGIYARSLEEFHYALEKLPQETFDFHMRDDQNDFASWLTETLKEHGLAEQLHQIKAEHGAHREKVIGAVRGRLSEQKKVDFI